jgi:hypothetical protein
MDFFGMDFFAKRESRVGKKEGFKNSHSGKKQKKLRRDKWRSCHYGYNLEGTTGGALVTTDINFEGTLGSALVTTVLLW